MLIKKLNIWLHLNYIKNEKIKPKLINYVSVQACSSRLGIWIFLSHLSFYLGDKPMFTAYATSLVFVSWCEGVTAASLVTWIWLHMYVPKNCLFVTFFTNSIQHSLLLLHFLLNCLMQVKLKVVDPLVIEDYSIESQFQGKHVIIFLPVLEDDNVYFVFKWFYTACVID